jgi:hypothetical protein
MYLRVNGAKIPIEVKTSFMDKLKSFRFKLSEIDYAICFPNKRRINTYFYCLRFDIIMTDKDNVILNIFENTRTEERYKGNKKVYYTYIFPSGVASFYEIGDKLDIVDGKKKKNNS